MEESDAVALARAREGSSDAFRALVERHSRSLFRLGYRMTGNEHDAEEVVQETFLRAYRKLGQFEARANFRTWLYRIAVNCATDLIRGRQRREERSSSLELESDGESLPLQLSSSNPSPERLLLSSEVQHRINQALDRLSPKERAAFVLRHFEGQSIEEISRVLGVRANAAKNNVFRAVQKLRKELEPLIGSTV